jgi:hypothetical protein
MRLLIPNCTDTDGGPGWSRKAAANLVVVAASLAERPNLV